MEEIYVMPKKKSKHGSKSECARGDTKPRSRCEKKEDISLQSDKTRIEKKVEKKRRRSQRRSKTDLIYSELQEIDENAEVLDIALPFRCLGKNSSLTDLNDLFQISDPPSPPLTHKQVNMLQLNENTALIMTKQIQQMKKQTEKLQKMIQESCNQKFSRDIDFIVNNLGKYFKKHEEADQV